MGEKSKKEIIPQVTPEMIEAGLRAWLNEANPRIEDADSSDRARIFAAIFSSMLKASSRELAPLDR